MVEPDGWPVDRAHQRFLHPTPRPDLTLFVQDGPCNPFLGQPVFQADEHAGFYRENGSWVIRLGQEGAPETVDRTAILEPSGKTGTLVMHVDQFPMLPRSYPLESPLEEILFRCLLPDRGATLVHACGVAWKGRGYLFVGSSGAGKSTTARLWKAAGASVLNDDRIVLEVSDRGLLIHPTPWSGDYPKVDGDSMPLAAMYLLRKGCEVAFEPLRPASALALLYAKSFPPLWDRDKIAASLDTLAHACSAVPCGWLTAPADQRAVAWVQAQP